MGRHILKYQALLLDTPNVILKVCQMLNPATLMLVPDLETPLHHFVETTEQVYSNWLDLKDEILLNPDAEWFSQIKVVS